MKTRYEATFDEMIQYAKDRGFIDDAIIEGYDLPKGIYRNVSLEWLAKDLKTESLVRVIDCWIIFHELDEDFNEWYRGRRLSA